MLMVDLMITLFHPKLDKFYCIGVMNKLEVIFYDLVFYQFFIHIKLSYYWFNRQKLLEKAKDRYLNYGSKEKAAEYFLKNREVLKEKSRSKYRNMSEEVKREYGRNMHRNMTKNAS